MSARKEIKTSATASENDNDNFGEQMLWLNGNANSFSLSIVYGTFSFWLSSMQIIIIILYISQEKAQRN